MSNRQWTIIFAVVALATLANAMLSLSIYQSLVSEMDENFTSDATMVDTWNEGSAFIAKQLVDLKVNQEQIAEHVGLDFVDGEMQPFDMECLLVSDDQDPPRLQCSKTFGNEG